MSDKALQIEEVLREFEAIQIRESFCACEDGNMRGEIAVQIPEGELLFSVLLLPCYPLHFQDVDSIRFINPELKTYNHVNPDGSICIHTYHSPDLRTKLAFDIGALQEWINTYYVALKEDIHYEHIFLPPLPNGRDVFLFTDFEFEFTRGDYGTLNYSVLNLNGNSNDKIVRTFFIKDLKLGKTKIRGQWAKDYHAKDLVFGVGAFIFLEAPPVKNLKYAYDNWEEFTPYFDQTFLKYLHQYSKSIKPQSAKIPLMIGYRIPSGEVHWQVAWLQLSTLPMEGVKNPSTKQWESELISKPIVWAETQNCSYSLFFGRGKLSSKLTEAKILIIGIGALGSIIATTLVRGGCKQLTIVDHDMKEPGNVCRSEYEFYTGLDNKVSELRTRLCQISPFVEVNGTTILGDVLKIKYEESQTYFTGLKECLEYFDIIIDCSTDNDLAYLTSKAAPNVLLLNISITNHAKELVCTTLPNSYEWMMDIFRKLESDTTDLYNPAGCWSPTFKASYNDISTLVQYAIKYINNRLEKGTAIRNFYLSTSEDDGFTIKLNPF